MIRVAFNGRHVGRRSEYRPRHCGCRSCRLQAEFVKVIPWRKGRHVVEVSAGIR